MKTIYVVMEGYHYDLIRAVKAFEDVDEASLFCREKNRQSCHTFFIEKTELKEKEN